MFLAGAFAQEIYVYSLKCAFVTVDKSNNSFKYSEMQACDEIFNISSTYVENTTYDSSNSFTNVYKIRKIYYIETKNYKMNILNCNNEVGAGVNILLKDYIDSSEIDEIIFMGDNSSRGVSFCVNFKNFVDLSKKTSTNTQ